MNKKQIAYLKYFPNKEKLVEMKQINEPLKLVAMKQIDYLKGIQRLMEYVYQLIRI